MLHPRLYGLAECSRPTIAVPMIDRSPHLVLAVWPDAVQARLDDLRRTHYPPERNRHPAHCTLFHAVPGMVAAELVDRIARLTAQAPPPAARIDRVVDLDRGTAPRKKKLRAAPPRDQTEGKHLLRLGDADLR